MCFGILCYLILVRVLQVVNGVLWGRLKCHHTGILWFTRGLQGLACFKKVPTTSVPSLVYMASRAVSVLLSKVWDSLGKGFRIEGFGAQGLRDLAVVV